MERKLYRENAISEPVEERSAAKDERIANPTEEEIANLDAIIGNLAEVRAGADLWQNDFHEFDVLGHTQKCVAEMAKLSADLNMRAAAWLHDIGKPPAALPKLDKDGRQMERQPGQLYHRFNDHEIMGEEMVKRMPKELFDRLGLDQEKVASLVGCHYLPMKGIKAMRKTENFADFVASFKQLERTLSAVSVTKEEILDMFVADSLSKGTHCTDQSDLMAVRDALLKQDASEDDLRKSYEVQKNMYKNKE